VRILTETVTSPTLAAQIQSLLQAMPQAKWHVWEPVNRDQVKLGAQQALGMIVDTHYKLDAADVVVSLDANFLNSTFHGFQRLAREFSRRRDPESGKPMLRFYAIESSPTNTGGKADHKLPVKASQLEHVARALSAIGNAGLRNPDGLIGMVGDAPAPPSNSVAFIAALVRDLQAHRGSSVVMVGDSAPASVHALAHQINAALGNVGKTVFYTDPVEPNPAIQQHSIADLMSDIVAKRVEMLFIIGGNPAYNAPADAGFVQNLANVPTTVHLASHFNETSAFCQWHVNEAHYLESWGDVRAEDGTVSIVQPLIAPLYAGKSAYELVAALGPNPDQSGYEIVRAYWQQQYKGPDFELFWRRTVHDGFMANTALPAKNVASKAAGAAPASTQAAQAGKIEINFRPDPTIYDGRFSNNAWLQEIPKPLTTLTWDNGVWFGVGLAEKLHVEMNDVVEIAVGGSKMEATVYVQPGQPDDSVTVFLGYGRTRAGHSGDGAGFNAYPLRANSTPWLAFGDIRKLDKKIPLAKISPDQLQHERELVRVAALDDYKKNPHFAKDAEHVPEPGETLYPEFKYDGYKWGMSIDINKCIGCNACIVACQAENNIPVVGKDQVLRRRPMHWLRVDTYYEGLDNPKIYFQPLPCMQCENAPCEYVCPVGATVHSTEGLNDMVYNRCVGTRYCSNNCPWKVRRFNFYLYQDWNTPQLKMMRNPEVSVRSRGVMEKCTYCTQRIVKARIEAEKAEQRIADGAFTTACAQACPAEAIVFGDMNDAGSAVNKRKSSPLDYLLLGELNTRPRTSYRAGVTNPNPELKGHDEAEHS
jgi:molybdopterin-containing oxidoreductase family iron-sulfur binding subunit